MWSAGIGALGNTKILMINCINIDFCVTLLGSNFTSGRNFEPETPLKCFTSLSRANSCFDSKT